MFTFTAQFHGNHHLISWANEGLAEYICTQGKGHDFKMQKAHEKIRRANSMEDFYVAKNISFDHYGAAFEMAALLLKKKPRGYAQFIKAVTEGEEADAALKTHCDMTLEQLTALYAKSIGASALKTH